MAYTYKYPRPSLTVDCVVFGYDEQELKICLIQRSLAPYEGKWALPGGFVRIEETLEDAAKRELGEEAGIHRVQLDQLNAFSELGRDPRERVVSMAFYALVKLSDHKLRAATDAKNAAWFCISDLPSLAFDHEKIVGTALNKLKEKTRYEPIGIELLPPKFTFYQLQRLYESLLENPLDKRNFRRKFLNLDILIETDEIEQDVAHRAARLYQFNLKRYQKLKEGGYHFDPQHE